MLQQIQKVLFQKLAINIFQHRVLLNVWDSRANFFYNGIERVEISKSSAPHQFFVEVSRIFESHQKIISKLLVYLHWMLRKNGVFIAKF